MIFYAASAANTYDLVALEAEAVGGKEVTITGGGVEFRGSLESVYKFCLYSRVASRLLMKLANDSKIHTGDLFYNASMKIPWEKYLDPLKTFSVTVTTYACPWLKNSTFGAMRLKDAVVDRIREYYDGQRPTVDIGSPDVTFHVHFERDEVTWYLDISGRSLHQRGYRKGVSKATLKENLAAAVLMRSEWYKTRGLLLDPFCGSGTIPIEAALIATDTAPGLLNPDRFAFLKLNFHDPLLWEEILEEAYLRHEAGIKKEVSILAWDIDEEMIEYAKENAKKAKVLKFINFALQDFTKIEAQDIPEGAHYVVSDPPYGKRSATTRRFYTIMGEKFNTLFPEWHVALLCGEQELLSYVDMKPNRTNTFYNGPIEAQLAHYRVFSKEERQAMIDKAIQRKKERLAQPLSEGAEMAYNRLKKNLARLGPLMESEGVTSYRLYDADMPEYSAAIDFYEGKYVHLQEYAPPKSVDEEAAQKRLQELIDATERATEVELEHLYIKQRMKQKGVEQYEKLDSTEKFYIMRENNHMFLVNFTDYLDTGIFLDHRPVRKMLEDLAKGKRFLNLFSYTGTATVHAAAGGALSTVSVDASATYLEWAKKNMEMNGFNTMNHFYYQEDCLKWLRTTNDTFDLIFCDPPTFSNSKERASFDIDRDHQKLIHSAMRHLSPDGTLIFSTNYRRFSMHPVILKEYLVKDITEETIAIDFQRNQKIHYCYLITHKKAIVKAQTKEIRTTKKIVRKK
ncbi:MAG: bifunctional 23S rRNA (guanine(2069)-N(7))-methyltransferase RlmK/23S rRNA (guanine(2445)-N(2))-methyltransferase RlmL [Sphaerochaetaceae bacterium]